MFKRLLIATDGTETSQQAVRKGLALAKSLGAEAVVLRVSGKPAHLVVLGLDITKLPENVQKEIQRRIDDHFAWVHEAAREIGVSCETLRVESEAPWQGILDTARDRSADLIVMATYGRHGVALRMVGSETMRVLTHSKVPVLVLH